MGMRGNGSMNSIPVTKFSNPGFNPCRLVFRKDTDRAFHYGLVPRRGHQRVINYIYAVLSLI